MISKDWSHFYSWQRMKDSNPHEQSQSLVCYHYTNPLDVPAIAGAGIIIAKEIHLSTGNFNFPLTFSF